MGDSSGGCLTAQFAITLRSLGLPMPAGLVLLSPFLDHELKSPSHQTNYDSDFVTFDLVGLRWAMNIYSNGLSTSHPIVTPLNADLAGLPPMLIQAGESETLTEDSIDFHRLSAAAGNKVELQMYADMFHVFQIIPFIPQTADAFDRIGHFVQKVMLGDVSGLSSKAVRITLVDGKCVAERHQ
ncbi:Alpha/Beta hydrolase protein [Entophlyctis helioformis]|nr:Alpha/Beta hydrolase protein [Entophlyctis helioformis]